MPQHSLGIVWYRRDLRLHDHEPLQQASKECNSIVACYTLDPHQLQPRHNQGEVSGVPVLGPHRLRFILQACESLDAGLRSLGHRLHFVFDRPPVALADVVRCVLDADARVSVVRLYHYQDVLPEEAELEEQTAEAVKAVGVARDVKVDVKSCWGLTLYHPEDLPWRQFGAGSCPLDATRPINAQACALNTLPDVMTKWRKPTQSTSQIRDPKPPPSKLPPAPAGFEHRPIPTLSEVLREATPAAREALDRLASLTGVSKDALCSPKQDLPTAFPFQGGEVQALARLRYYLWGSEDGKYQADAAALHYFADARMQAVGVDNSTKLSAFLGQGCLSPRRAHEEIQRFNDAAGQRGDKERQCNWLIMHLCIRDFFIFSALKSAGHVLHVEGIQGKPVTWHLDAHMFLKWSSGRSGIPFLDACMRELAATGYMSNRGRQNVASFLAKTLQQDWRWGAQLFESLLVDCDPAVNYSNWNYFAGIGSDPRNRVFKTVSQGLKYDEDALLIAQWVPELRHLEPHERHQPWLLSADHRASEDADSTPAGPDTYPAPMVDPNSQVGHPKGKSS